VNKTQKQKNTTQHYSLKPGPHSKSFDLRD